MEPPSPFLPFHILDPPLLPPPSQGVYFPPRFPLTDSLLRKTVLMVYLFFDNKAIGILMDRSRLVMSPPLPINLLQQSKYVHAEEITWLSPCSNILTWLVVQ
ncbi:hypothetical protein QQP08_000531 [Theobroma cacao]|nr:hypothetical protein QQP08_000531 [Theobroma cacao]